MGANMNGYRALVGKPEGKRTLEKHRHKWEDNIKMNLREMGWGCMDWIYQPQYRDQWRGSCECDNEPSGSTRCWEIPE
jgi:hypothetical protein